MRDWISRLLALATVTAVGMASAFGQAPPSEAGAPKKIEEPGEPEAPEEGEAPALSAAPTQRGSVTYADDIKAFVNEIDSTYPYFDLKGIRKDWSDIKGKLIERAQACQSEAEFFTIAYDAVRCLRDGHMGITPSNGQMPEFPKEYCPAISFMPAAENRVVILYAPNELGEFAKTGTIVARIDGQDARSYLEDRASQAWRNGGFFSSPQRARLFEYRIALRGAQGEEHKIAALVQGKEQTITVKCTEEARGWPHVYNMPEGLDWVGRSFLYTKLPSGVGYMYWRRVDQSIPEGMDAAITKYPDAHGWIVDLRGNGGGGYDEALRDRIRALTRPVAALIDAGCFSAGETLARDLKALGEARLFGSTTAGSSGKKRQWTFPSGVATVRISVRSHSRQDGRPIEFNGVAPDVEVEVVPEEILAGRDSVILRAEEHLLSLPVEAPAASWPAAGSSSSAANGRTPDYVGWIGPWVKSFDLKELPRFAAWAPAVLWALIP